MPVSLTTQAIRRVSALCAPALAGHGFKRQSPHFHRLTPGGLYHFIHFQASQWGSHDEGSFTLNLGVSSPWLYTKWTTRPFPKNPGSALWPVQQRIGSLLPGPRDIWWTIDAAADIDAIGAEISDTLVQHGLRFFDYYSDTDALLDRALSAKGVHGASDAQHPLIASMLLVERGDTVRARTLLEQSLHDYADSRFCDTIREIARRLNIDLQPG